MAKTIKESITKSVKKPKKPTSTKVRKIEPDEWYAKAKASIGISKIDKPMLPHRSR